MTERNWLTVILGAVSSIFFTVGSCTGSLGCAPKLMPEEFASAVQAVTASQTAQTVLDRVAQRAGAEGINPGLRTGAGVEYYAYARLEGIAGRVSLEGDGHGRGTPLTDEEKAQVMTGIYRSDADRSAILRKLFWVDEKPAPPAQ